MDRDDEKMKKKKRKSDSSLCIVQKRNSNGTEGPSWGEMLVIQGQSVDDVITIAPTNLVLYIIMPTTLPLLSHVDPSPATTSPLCLVNGSFYL